MILVTREFKFDAAHYLDGYKGDCANLHGHTWRFAVTVGADKLDGLGMAIDFKKMKEIVNKQVVDRLDHKCLNHVIPFNPTAENLAMWIYRQLMIEFCNVGVTIENIKLWENYPECYVEYGG